MWIYVSVIAFLCQFASGYVECPSEMDNAWIIKHEYGGFACTKGEKTVGQKLGPKICELINNKYEFPEAGKPLSCSTVPPSIESKCPAYKSARGTSDNPVTVTAKGTSHDGKCVAICKYFKKCQTVSAHQGYWNDIFEDDRGLQSQSGFMPYVWPSQMAYPAASTSSDGSISGVMIMVIVLLILVACMVCFGMNILVGAACYFVGRDQKNRGASYVKVDHEHDQI
mmetsp:Transcript_14776/g.22233  ORF Transcript_14776/g.22233 Transcript_14776/m.22233 type:complete len:225 (+) Transcript_14776:85-759(+)